MNFKFLQSLNVQEFLLVAQFCIYILGSRVCSYIIPHMSKKSHHIESLFGLRGVDQMTWRRLPCCGCCLRHQRRRTTKTVDENHNASFRCASSVSAAHSGKGVKKTDLTVWCSNITLFVNSSHTQHRLSSHKAHNFRLSPTVTSH